MPKFLGNGIELYYEEKGSGEALILLHGLTSNHLMLKQEMEYFQDQFRVIGLDARGHGESDKPSHYNLNDHIQDVISLMDYLKIEKANLLGMSMGTYIAQGLAITVPDRIDKMVLVSGSSHGKKPSEGLLAEHEKEVKGLAFDEQLGRLSKYIFFDLEAVGNWLKTIPGRLTPEQQEIAANALAGFDFRPNLSKVKAKTLVISGKYDGLNPPEDGKMIADLIPNARFVLFEKSGHAPNVEETELFMELVSGFLR